MLIYAMRIASQLKKSGLKTEGRNLSFLVNDSELGVILSLKGLFDNVWRHSDDRNLAPVSSE